MSVEPYRPRALMAVLVLLIVLGCASVVGAVVSAQTAINSKRDASVQNNTLLREVRIQNYELCLRAERIARQAGLTDEPCPAPAELGPIEEED